MCLKIIMVAFAISAVVGRPQFVNTVPVLYQTQRYLVNPEPVILVPTIGPTNTVTLYYTPVNQNLPQSVNSRNAEIASDINMPPNQNDRRHLQSGTTIHNNMPPSQNNNRRHLQSGTLINNHAQTSQNLVNLPTNNNASRLNNVIYTNKPKGQGQNISPTTSHSTSSVPKHTQTNYERVSNSDKNVATTYEKGINTNRTSIDMATDKAIDTSEKHKTNMDRSYVSTDRDRGTVRQNENTDVYRSNNSGADSRTNMKPVVTPSNNYLPTRPTMKFNPPVTPSYRPEERTGATEGSEDKWVWGVDDMKGEVLPSTPDVDDRGNFGGNQCPKNKTKIQGQCVDKD